MHIAPRAQPFVWWKAHGLHWPEPWLAEPEEGMAKTSVHSSEYITGSSFKSFKSDMFTDKSRQSSPGGARGSARGSCA